MTKLVKSFEYKLISNFTETQGTKTYLTQNITYKIKKDCSFRRIKKTQSEKSIKVHIWCVMAYAFVNLYLLNSTALAHA